ncbi:MAG: hypothetical protein MR357_00665 [Anaeroplasma sp.]|nr:hypothetical protein [Anaeroplasma sp.]
MSLVVGIKYNDVIYIGADSCVVSGGNRYILDSESNFKIHRFENGLIIGSTGYFRDIGIVKTMSFDFEGELNYQYIVRYLVPKIIEELESFGYIKRDGGYFDTMNSKFLVAYKNSLFFIGTDGAVKEINDYVAIGSGESEAYGSLLTNRDDIPENRILEAIKSASMHDNSVSLPVVIMSTSNDDYKILK